MKNDERRHANKRFLRKFLKGLKKALLVILGSAYGSYGAYLWFYETHSIIMKVYLVVGVVSMLTAVKYIDEETDKKIDYFFNRKEEP